MWAESKYLLSEEVIDEMIECDHSFSFLINVGGWS